MTLSVSNNNNNNNNNSIQFYSCADSSTPGPITERTQTHKYTYNIKRISTKIRHLKENSKKVKKTKRQIEVAKDRTYNLRYYTNMCKGKLKKNRNN